MTSGAASTSSGSGSPATVSAIAASTGCGAGSSAAGSSNPASNGSGSTAVSVTGGRSAVSVPRKRSYQPAIRRSLSSLRSGLPLRERSCVSPGKRTISTVFPSRRRAPNISSDWEIAQRRSISPHVSRSGVFTLLTYRIGDFCHSSSMFGHGGGPSSSWPHSTMSCCEYSLTRLESERIATAAPKRSVWPMIQLVMNPP